MSEIIDIFYYGLKQMIMILGKYWYKHHEDGKGNLAVTIVRKRMNLQKGKNFKQNYVKVSYASDSDDDCLDVEHNSYEEGPSSPTCDDSDENDGHEILQNNLCDDSVPCGENSFVQQCIAELLDNKFLESLLMKLDDNGHLNDFRMLLKLLQSGEFPMDNIVFILLLEHIRFQKCPNTVGMRYSDRTKLCWTIVYQLCKGSGLKFFSGPKNWGQVVNKECDKSHYNPSNAKLNFAVPDEKILRESQNGIPKLVPPGKIVKCLDMLSNKKDIVLMADGKLVTKGLKESFLGDVNLFGHETTPNLAELKSTLESHITYIGRCCESFKGCNYADQYEILLELLQMNTQLLPKIRAHNSVQRKILSNFTSRDASSNIPDKAISTCKTEIYTSNIWIRNALKQNLEICKMMASHQNNLHFFSTVEQDNFSNLQNSRFLYDSAYVCKHINSREYPNLIKKYSDEWYELVKESYITSDTVCSALGLNGVNAMKMHFKQFVKDEATEDFASKKCYSQSNINSLITMNCIVTPSILPSWALFYEEGCAFLDGRNKINMLCSTHTGIIR